MTSYSSDFDSGFRAGSNADDPLSPFAMSQYADGFAVGYVVALAERHGICCASAIAAGCQAAEMGKVYRIPYERLEPYFDDPDNPEALDALRAGYDLENDDGDYFDDAS